MLSLPSEVRFWSTQDDIAIKSTDYSCYKYYFKKEPSDQLYQLCKRKYVEQRGLKCTISNKRPEKLKDKLCELEDLLSQNKIVAQAWNEDILQILLSKGVIITLKLNLSDIIGINFDRNLVPKTQTEAIVDGAFYGNQVVCITKEGRVFGQGGLWKDWVIESGARRNINFYGELLVVWGKTGCEHPQPWSPLAKDHQRANLHLYWIGTRGPDLLSYRKTDGEPIKVVISKVNTRSVIVVEQKVSQRGAVSIDVCLLELIGNALKRSSVTAVPLQTQVSCTSLSSKETYLILGCIDGSLAVLDRNRGSSRIIKASFIPTHVAWHESEALAAISNERGQIQYYDTALNCVNTQLVGEDLSNNMLDISSYFNTQHTVETLFWGPYDLVVALEQGPLLVITHGRVPFDFNSLVKMYLYSDKTERAIRLLLSWDFNEEAFRALQMIVAKIMRTPLIESTAKMLQDALGSFHSPSVPLSVEVRHKFGPQVKSLTRRFFHHLVRTKMYETAFLLAVDLGHHDLFMDLHYIAVKIGETEMAAAARAQASALLSRCSSAASNCSRSLCSQCSDSTSESSQDSSKDESRPHQSSDNYLSTNFNNPVPKTYKPSYVPPIPNIDLPKIKLANKPLINVPPLPSTPMHSSLNTLGIPFTARVTPPPQLRLTNPFNQLTLPSTYLNESRFVPIRTVSVPPRIAPFRMAPPLRIAPPLPIASCPAVPQVKKPQAKVKFSDTVTAFIVPEVKRPVRIPPPAHVTDPQKELADSLPLCHPNEDYLKDFTPIRRETSESPPVQPKIKVVHFGVV